MSQLSQQKPPISSPNSLPICFKQQPRPWLYAFWKFSRPHTIVGTSLSVLALFVISLSSIEAWGADNPSISWLLLFPALLACLCGNVYIVGLNQLEDVEIDRINKPHLPLASGEFSRQQGWAIVITMGILALLLSAWQGIFLMATVWVSLLIGTAYSLPPVRLKRFPIWASLCIFSVRGAIVNLGLFLHFQQKLNSGAWSASIEEVSIPATVWALTLFVLVFTFAIAVFKDIPDLEGDRRYHITTFTVRLGQKSVFNLARWVLTLCYLGMIVAAGWLESVNTWFLVVTHGIALISVWLLSRQVNLQDNRSIAQFYQFIWKLFFLEYLLFPAACLLS